MRLCDRLKVFRIAINIFRLLRTWETLLPLDHHFELYAQRERAGGVKVSVPSPRAYGSKFALLFRSRYTRRSL